MQDIVLSTTRVSFGYNRKTRMIDDISIELHKGEFLYIRGKNASGKSTLLKVICGLLRPCSGKVELFQKDPHESPDILREVGVVVDGMGMYKELSLRDNVILFAREKGMEKKEIINSLEKFEEETGIDFTTKYKEASHGMRKITKLILSLINDPSLLIWDEPELALDKKREKWLVEKLKSYKEEKRAGIIVGTDPTPFSDVIDDVIEMEVIV